MISRNSFNSYVEDNLNKRINTVKAELCVRIEADTNNLVPYKTGKLASEVDTLENNSGIRYSAEYAPFVVDMPSSTNFNKSAHSEATSSWNTISTERNKEDWYNFFKRRVSNGNSGK